MHMTKNGVDVGVVPIRMVNDVQPVISRICSSKHTVVNTAEKQEDDVSDSVTQIQMQTNKQNKKQVRNKTHVKREREEVDVIVGLQIHSTGSQAVLTDADVMLGVHTHTRSSHMHTRRKKERVVEVIAECTQYTPAPLECTQICEMEDKNANDPLEKDSSDDDMCSDSRSGASEKANGSEKDMASEREDEGFMLCGMYVMANQCNPAFAHASPLQPSSLLPTAVQTHSHTITQPHPIVIASPE